MPETEPRKSDSWNFGIPPWFHTHGHKISVVGFNSINSPTGRTLLMQSPNQSAEVEIFPDPIGKGWIVKYKIRHANGSHSESCVWMSEDNIRIAFGLPPSNKSLYEIGQEILERYGGDAAHQGMYIRYGNFLSIPGPGTGYDGDPNLSIYVDDEMRTSVRMLLER